MEQEDLRRKCVFVRHPQFVSCVLLEILPLYWPTNEAEILRDAITEECGSLKRGENSTPVEYSFTFVQGEKTN